MKNLRWSRILISGLVLFFLIFASINLIITGYAIMLGIKAQGAPDGQQIADFAVHYGPIISIGSATVFSFLTSAWTAREIHTDLPLHCLLITAIGAVLVIGYGLAFSSAVWNDIIAALGMLVVYYPGALAGKKMAQSRTGI